MEFLALGTGPFPPHFVHQHTVMCHSPVGCISPACLDAAPARGRASGRSEVQFLGHSFRSTGRACTTRPLQGGWFGKLLLAPAER